MHREAEYHIRAAETDRDLQQIIDLQAANLRSAMDAAQRRANGFVTLEHNLPLLREMNSPWPHVVAARAGTDEVVGYALVMEERFRERLAVLGPMFDELDHLSYRGRPLVGEGRWRWYVMGQICIAASHRGRGLVERLYAEHARRMAPHFDLMVTEIDRANARSMRAHEKAGFEVLHTYRAGGGEEWVIVVRDLRGRV